MRAFLAALALKAAKVFSKVSVFVQGGVVAANLRFAF